LDFLWWSGRVFTYVTYSVGSSVARRIGWLPSLSLLGVYLFPSCDRLFSGFGPFSPFYFLMACFSLSVLGRLFQLFLRIGAYVCLSMS
jgi:hypothetical protein